MQAPTDVGATYPAMQQRQVAIGDAKTQAQGWNLEQIEQIAGSNAGMGQAQQFFQRLNQWIDMAPTLICQTEMNVTQVLPVDQPEYRMDMRGIGINVRHHDDNVART